MTVKVEVLYVPTCASFLMWLQKIRKIVADYGGDVAIEEIDVSQHPEALQMYQSCGWHEFKEGYIHYFILVAIDGKVVDDWYWDVTKISDTLRQEIKLEADRR